jgi:hypothetical protein
MMMMTRRKYVHMKDLIIMEHKIVTLKTQPELNRRIPHYERKSP